MSGVGIFTFTPCGYTSCEGSSLASLISKPGPCSCVFSQKVYSTQCLSPISKSVQETVHRWLQVAVDHSRDKKNAVAVVRIVSY